MGNAQRLHDSTQYTASSRQAIPTMPPSRDESTVTDLILVVICFFLPPVTAFITDGCGGQFCLNILLTLLGFIPGFIHGLWLIFRSSRSRQLASGPVNSRYSGHSQQGQYAVVNHPPSQQQQYPQQQPQYAPPPTEPVHHQQGPAPGQQIYVKQ